MICPRCAGRLISGWSPREGQRSYFSLSVIFIFPILAFLRWTFPRLACPDCRVPIAVRELESPYRGTARMKQIFGVLLFLGFISLFFVPIFLMKPGKHH
jgi:hypothetical protein